MCIRDRRYTIGQNTTGVAPTAPNIGPQNGVSFNSDANFKDLYGRLVYRFNLEKDPASRNDVQAAGTMGPRDHTYLCLLYTSRCV